MTQRDNILQELNELGSSLVKTAPQNVYAVPDGYFENLVGQVLIHIKALDAKEASEELSYLSPLLNNIPRKMPYSVPTGFFTELLDRIKRAKTGDEQTAAEELSTLSPLLGGLKKEMPYAVPEGYFERLEVIRGKSEATRPVAKVIAINKTRWIRFAAAAAVIGFVAIGSILLFSKHDTIDPKTQSSAWVNK